MIITSTPLLKALGAAGYSGTKAWNIVTNSDGVLNPTEFSASTVNSYVVPSTKSGTV
jgi:hypothetical protein